MPIHHLMVGTWTPPGAIFTFAFDDEELTLELVKRTPIPVDEPISWMTFDVGYSLAPRKDHLNALGLTPRVQHDKKNIYGAAMKKWSSFAVASPTDITHKASHPMLHHPAASSPDTNTRAIFLLAARHPPYAVYCNPFYDFAGQGSVFSVDPSGTLAAPIQHFDYQPDSGIHGMVFDPPTGTHLYSADLRANRIWVHRRPDPARAELRLVGSVPCPDPRDRPRWLAMPASGRFLYVLMEKGNRLCEYALNNDNDDDDDDDDDDDARMPRFTGRAFPLIPPGVPERDRWTMYRADVCALSASGEYLFASARANEPGRTGYIAAFKIDQVGGGRIERQICLNPTPTSGGHSNAVAPSPWTDEWVAITDDVEGWLEVYRWKEEFLARVARIRVPEPGFGMNAIWYD